METILISAAFIILGALAMMQLRDDDVEDVFGIGLRRWFWLPSLLLLGVGSLYFTKTDIAVWQYVLNAALLILIITPGHGPALRGPDQDIRADNKDPLWRIFIGQHNVGKRMGWLRWGSYMFFRYTVPVALLSLTTGTFGPIIAGLLIPFSHWPVGMWLATKVDTTDDEYSKFTGAFVMGWLIFSGVSIL